MMTSSDQESPGLNNASPNMVFIIQPHLDVSYMKTPSGIIKIILIVLNLLGFICVISSAFRWHARGVFFNVVAHLGLWYSFSTFILYLYHVIEKYHHVPWLRIEQLGGAMMVFLYIITATLAVGFGSDAFSAAGFFGYLAMVLYGVEVFLRFRSTKNGELAQGHRITTKQMVPPAST